jgi:non-specific serine/threonine protein kinase
MRRGRLDEATRLTLESLTISQRTGNTWGQALSLGNLGYWELLAGRLDAAEPLVRESLELTRALGNRRDLPIGLMELSEIARRRGDVAGARALLEEALAVATDIGDWIGKGGALLGLAALVSTAGDLDLAVSDVRRAIEIQVAAVNDAGENQWLTVIADIAVAADDMTAAARFAGAADAMAGQHHRPGIEAFPGEHDQRIDAIRGALGHDAFRTAWEAGQALTVDEMVAEALAWEPPPGTVPQSRSAEVRTSPAETLSRREREVLRLMAEGLSNQQIADRLFLSRRTATSHASNILGKLGLETRTAAVAWAIRNGLA